jgi:hypothetical protein
VCTGALIGKGQIVFECGHGVHLHCGRPLVKAGNDRCLPCARAVVGGSVPGQRAVVPLGNLSLQNQLLLQQMQTARSTSQVRVRRSRRRSPRSQ